MMQVYVAYVGADDGDGAYYQCLDVPVGSSIWQVLQSYDGYVLTNLPQFAQWCQDNLDQDPNHKAWYVGVYSVKQRLDYVLQDGDRVEIYRSLSYDPMTRRKSKSKPQNRRMGRVLPRRPPSA